MVVHDGENKHRPATKVRLSFAIIQVTRQSHPCDITYIDAVNTGPGKWNLFILINTLRPRQNGRYFTDDVFKWIFLNENAWISLKISLKFVPKVRINNIPAMVQIMAWRRPGDKPLSEPMMVSLLTHICVTRPQWVKTSPVSRNVTSCCMSTWTIKVLLIIWPGYLTLYPMHVTLHTIVTRLHLILVLLYVTGTDVVRDWIKHSV